MIALGPVVLLILIIVIVYVATQSARSDLAGTPPGTLDEQLARWTAAGLLSEREAAAIARYEHEPPSPALGQQPLPHRTPAQSLRPTSPARQRVPAVAEALGYLGGILAVIGLVLIVSRYWPDMATAVRLALSAAGAAGLFVAGALVRSHDDAALERLRGFAWVASSASAAVFAGVVAADVFEAESTKVVVAAGSSAVSALSALLWRSRRLVFQQLTLFAALVVLVGSLVALLAATGPTGIAVWMSGAALVAVGIRRYAPAPAIGEIVGGASMAVGTVMTVDDWGQPAFLFATATAGLLLALALVPGLAPDRADQIRIGALGTVVGAQGVPASIGYFAHEAGLVTGLATWAVAAGLLLLGIRELLRVPLLVEVVGAIGVLVGAAVTAAQFDDVGPIFGVVTAIGLVALGMLPGHGVLSLFGSAGLLVNVLWAITHFFPGEGRAPLLIMVAGALILATAVLLTRRGTLRRSQGARQSPPRGGPPRAAPGAV